MLALVRQLLGRLADWIEKHVPVDLQVDLGDLDDRGGQLMAWLALFVTVRWNWHEHTRGRATMCSVTRKLLPKWAVVVLIPAGALALLMHLIRGYPARPKV